MFNVGEKTVIKGIEKLNSVGVKFSHLTHQLTSGQHEPVRYKYFGSRVSKGKVVVHTCKGDFELYFEEENGLCRLIEVL